MIGQAGQGWATTLADLSIILFMITAADLSNAEIVRDGLADREQEVAAAEPVAIYRPGGGALSLRDWLAGQPDDPRQRLTIVVRYMGTESSVAIGDGLRLASDAEATGREARIIIEKSDRSETAAILAYDSDPRTVARELQRRAQSQSQQRKSTENVR